MSALDDLARRIDTAEARIGVVGLGYVGLPLALEFCRAGFEVTGFDVDAGKRAAIEAGTSYIDDIPSEAVAEARASGKLTATSDGAALADCDVISVCVPTPLTRTRDPDVSHIARAIDQIAEHIHAGQLVILGSTSYPGTTQELIVPMLEGTGLTVGVDFAVAFAPERINPGDTRFAVRDIPKVVGGATPVCTELAAKVFRHVFDEVVPVSSTESAEMVKLLENTFRAINIGLVNEVALMCHRLGLDVWEVIDAAATKPYGFMKFQPGPGLGGHCIPVDPTYLSWKMKSLNFPARFIDLATEINTQMPAWVADRVADLLNQDRIALNGARVLILGVAYKANVADLRESPALDVMRLLADRGAEVRYSDPHVPELLLGDRLQKSVDLTDAALAGADVVVVVTEHDAVDYARVVARATRVYDTRNATRDVSLHREKIEKL